MEVLRELVEFCSARSVRLLLRSEGKADDSNTLIARFYELLRQGKLPEREIVVRLYGEEATTSLPRYQALKTRLKKLLYDAVLISSTDDSNVDFYEAADRMGQRNCSVARVLASRNKYHSASELLLKTWTKVHKYEIPLLNFDIASALSGLHLGPMYDEKMHLKFSQEAQKYFAMAIASYEILKMHRSVRNAIYARRMPPLEIGRLAIKLVSNNKSIQEKYLDVPVIQTLCATTEIQGYSLLGKYKEAIEAAERGTMYLKKCESVSGNSMSLIGILRLESFIKFHEFEFSVGQINLERNSNHHGPKATIRISELAIRLGLNTREYLYSYCELAHCDFAHLRLHLKPKHLEYWLILEAWVNFLLEAGKVNPGLNSPGLRKFKLGKFINSVPSHSGLKKGMNIQILILQIAFFLLRK
ncbi:MAG: hypothetical protein AAFN92_07195, partial [Bacteroidota bacterium]